MFSDSEDIKKLCFNSFCKIIKCKISLIFSLKFTIKKKIKNKNIYKYKIIIIKIKNWTF